MSRVGWLVGAAVLRLIDRKQRECFFFGKTTKNAHGSTMVADSGFLDRKAVDFVGSDLIAPASLLLCG